MQTIDENIVRHIAELSRLALSDDELHTYTEQLSAILDYASHLPDLPEQVSELADMRAAADVSLSSDDPHGLLRNAVAFENGYVKVPAILDKGGDA